MVPDTVHSQTVNKRILTRARTSFVGRQKELAILRSAVESAEFQYLVIFIHGVGGIGKSRLLQTALDSLSPAIRRHIIDCRNVEPTPEGFLLALGETIGAKSNAGSGGCGPRRGRPRHRARPGHLRDF